MLSKIKVWYVGSECNEYMTYTGTDIKHTVKRHIGNDPLITYIGKSGKYIHCFVDIMTGKEYRARIV